MSRVISLIKSNKLNEAADLLFQSKIDINEINNVDGNTALVLAARNGHTEIVKLLLDKGTAIDKPDQYGNTALTWAVEKGHTEIVKLLLDKGTAVDKPNQNGSTALTWAAHYGHPEIVKLLLDKGATVDKPGQYGNTALTWAAQNGHPEITWLLIAFGGDNSKLNSEYKRSVYYTNPTIKSFFDYESAIRNSFLLLKDCEFNQAEIMRVTGDLSKTLVSSRKEYVSALMDRVKKLTKIPAKLLKVCTWPQKNYGKSW